MNVQRGEVWLADLDPTRGSEQAGTRPVLVLQNDAVNRFTRTVVAVPFTTNLRRESLPTSVRVASGDGGLASDSVALCHQLRVLDKRRLFRKLGSLRRETLTAVDDCVLFTLGITLA